jgi:ribosomal protein S18 acetylase RimI-like enzyme
VFRPPLERNLTWPFHPHVTLLDNGDEATIRAAVDALAAVRFECVIDRVHLLREANEDGVRSWHPIAEAAFGGPSVVGRGGLELELDVTERLPLDAAAWSERAWAEHGGPWPKVPLAVTARRDGRIVGTVDGDTRPNGEAYLAHLIVGRDVRREGVGVHLVAAFSSAAAARGATFLSVRTERGGPAVSFYERLGFEHWYDLPRWRGDKDHVQLRRSL